MASLDALAAKLDDLKEFTKNEFKEVKERQDKTNGRVMDLERWRWGLAGGMAVITMLILPVAYQVTDKFLDYLFG